MVPAVECNTDTVFLRLRRNWNERLPRTTPGLPDRSDSIWPSGSAATGSLRRGGSCSHPCGVSRPQYSMTGRPTIPTVLNGINGVLNIH
jgi:hypothetical protein